MAGCFGNSPHDRYLESELLHHLDTLDEEEEDTEFQDAPEKSALERRIEMDEALADQRRDDAIIADMEKNHE